MTQYKEPVITRTEDIVVRSTTKNTRGYLVVTDEGDKKHSISPKRDRLFPIFEVGKAIHLSYAEFEVDGKPQEYIANATPLEQMIKTIPSKGLDKPPESKPPLVKPTAEKYRADPAKTESIERQTSLKAAVELAVAGRIEIDQIISFAAVFDMYLSGDFVESESDIITKYLAKYKKGGK